MHFVDLTYFYEFSLTRSSSAVRLGARTGACGTLGSLPRFGGKGSSGKPLHTSFREDIPSPSRFSGLRWSQRMADPPLQVNTPHFTPPSKPTNGEARADYVFGIYWFPECLKRRMQQKTNIATDHGPQASLQSNKKKNPKTLYHSSNKLYTLRNTYNGTQHLKITCVCKLLELMPFSKDFTARLLSF